MSERRYSDLTTSGRYRSSQEHEPTGMSVRAPGAPHEDDTSARPPRSYRLFYSQVAGLYRLYYADEDAMPTDREFVEIERYGSDEAVRKMIRHWPRLLRHVVYEDPETGALTQERFDSGPGDWLAATESRRFVLFSDEADAEQYATEGSAEDSAQSKRKNAA